MNEKTAYTSLHQSLRELNILIDAADRRILSKYKLRSVRFYALEGLYKRPALTLGELSDHILIGRASASRMVFSMEKDGLVLRTPDPNDRRVFALSLTEKGNDLYRRIRAELDADIASRFAAFDMDTLTNTAQLHQRLKEALQAHLESVSGS